MKTFVTMQQFNLSELYDLPASLNEAMHHTAKWKSHTNG